MTEDVTAAEVIQVFQARFPREFEIAVLTVQNTKLRQQISNDSAVDAPDDIGV